MATTRFGHLDDFTLKNSKVGIGTSTPTEALEVIGGSRGGSANVTGIATLTSYEGFQNKKTSYADNIHVDSGESGTLSGEVVIGAGLTMSVGTGATTGQGSVKSLKVSNTFTPPIGGTNDRPTAPQPGALYYNKDFRTIEYWDGKFWRQVDNTTRRGRAVTGMWENASGTDLTNLDFVDIQSQGNAQNFGDLTVARMGGASCSSSTRGLWAGGNHSPTKDDEIDYITIASECNAIDFGNLTSVTAEISGCSSSTRGLFAGGQTPSNTNVIQYVEISTIGNAVDFGDLRNGIHATISLSSSTRGFWAGGSPDGADKVSYIDVVTISSKGNAYDWGDLTKQRKEGAGASNSVRGVFAGGPYNDGWRDTIDYINLASAGNAIDFGTLTVTRGHFGGASDQTRAVFFAGRDFSDSPNVPRTNVIDYVEIATTGNAMDFGDCTGTYRGNTACSDSHGGLGGF